MLKKVPGVVPPAVASWGKHVFHQYTIRVPRRDRVQKILADQGIATTVYYPTPIHAQPIYASLGYRSGDLPETERASREVLSLPMYPELSQAQVERVADAVEAQPSSKAQARARAANPLSAPIARLGSPESC